MSKQESYLVYVDCQANNNKFLKITQDGLTLTSEWGRVGDTPQRKSWTFSSESTAEKEFAKKIKEKTRKGYDILEVAGSNQTQTLAGNINGCIKDIALRDIQTNNEEARKLIQYLTEVNIHQILENTTMNYSVADGVFTTPLGVVVGQSTIDKARDALAGIKAKIINKLYNDTETIKLANQYLRLIPQNLGHASKKLDIRKIFPDENSIISQANIIDSLEASLKTVTTQGNNNDSNKTQMVKTFDLKIYLIEDSKIIDNINKLYKSTLQSIHESSRFKLQKVYEVDISTMRQAWENDGVKVGNVKRLWHGSKPSNLLSILKKGLIIPPANASYVCGRAYGNGVYFSDQSTKSLNYACGYWDGKRVDKCFMFLSDVALGKTYVPSSYDRDLPKKGYDSTSALAGRSGVINNEYIVYRVSQANLVYLVEFEK